MLFRSLLKKIHKLDRMTFADLKISVDPEYDPKVTIEGSKEYIEKGLSILGPEYVDMIREAYRDRWVDFAKNQGKSTGGFCASPYGTNSFILLSWNDRMADVFTLAHELGHAGHFRACNSAQSIFDTDVSSYLCGNSQSGAVCVGVKPHIVVRLAHPCKFGSITDFHIFATEILKSFFHDTA